MMPIEAPRIAAPPALVALLAPQPMPKNQLLGHAEGLVRVVAPAAAAPAARSGQVERVAVPLAADRRLMVDALDSAGRPRGQRGVDAVVIGIDEDDVVGQGGGGWDRPGETGGWSQCCNS